MAATPLSRAVRPILSSTRPERILSFLVPSLQCTHIVPAAHFSTSPARCKRDNNSMRGVSAVRATGLRPRQTLSVIRNGKRKGPEEDNFSLPKPVEIIDKPTGRDDHGLWDFFNDKKLLQLPTDMHRHGREWTVPELRSFDWDDLHQLWWVCVKERNRLATEKITRRRLDTEYGDYESDGRDETIQKTMKAILDTLKERELAWREAVKLSKKDPTIRMEGGVPTWVQEQENAHDDNQELEDTAPAYTEPERKP